MKKIMRIMMLIVVFCVSNSFVMCTSLSLKEKEIEKIKKEVVKTNENIFQRKYKRHTMIAERDARIVLKKGDEVAYYTENGELRKIETVTTIDTDEQKGKLAIEYYIRDGFPYYWKESFIPGEKGKYNETKVYYKLENDGTVGELLRIVREDEIDDGENDEFFGRGMLRDYGSVLYLVEEHMGVREKY